MGSGGAAPPSDWVQWEGWRHKESRVPGYQDCSAVLVWLGGWKRNPVRNVKRETCVWLSRGTVSSPPPQFRSTAVVLRELRRWDVTTQRYDPICAPVESYCSTLRCTVPNCYLLKCLWAAPCGFATLKGLVVVLKWWLPWRQLQTAALPFYVSLSPFISAQCVKNNFLSISGIHPLGQLDQTLCYC